LVSGLSTAYSEFRLRKQFRAGRTLPRYAGIGSSVHYPVTIQTNRPVDISDFFIEEQLPDPRPSLATFINAKLAADKEANFIDNAVGYPRWLNLIRIGVWAEKPEPTALSTIIEKGSATEQISLTPLRRGYLRLPGLLLTRPDPLGLFRLNIRVRNEQSLLVLPKRYPVPRLNLPGNRHYQPGGMTLASSMGDSQEFIGLREYRSGDPLRHIHWPSWARSGKPQVKEFQDEFFTRHALILDTFSDNSHDPNFEAAVSVAASLCESVQDGDSLLDLMFVGTEAYCFTAGRSLAGTEQFMEILACAKTCSDRPFDTLSHSVTRRSGQLSAAVCILLDFDGPRRELVKKLQAAGLPIRVLLITNKDDSDRLLSGWQGETPTLIDPTNLAEDLARL